MSNFRSLSDPTLLSETRLAAAKEKEATLRLLDYLLEVDRRGIHFNQGYASLWEYVHRGLGYSEAGASERVSAMRLIRRAPEAKKLLEDQKLTLTAAAKVQTFIKAVEKSERRKVGKTETADLLKEVAQKSKREIERILIAKAPEAAIPKENIRELTSTLTELRLVVDRQFIELLEEAKALYGCNNPSEAILRALEIAVQQKAKQLGLGQKAAGAEDTRSASRNTTSKKLSSPSTPSSSRYISAEVKRALWDRSESRCEYMGPEGRCTSQHRLEIDHKLPLALGGTSNLDNLRLLCKNHNLSEARAWGLGFPPHGPSSDVDGSNVGANSRDSLATWESR